MTNDYLRDYGCKDEELTVICKFAAFSLNRDLSEFSVYSPKFNATYVTGFENNITAAINLVAPESEMLEQKTITARLYTTLDGLIDPINRLTGYIKLSNLSITAVDFGLTHLRKGINTRDAEGTMNSLRTVLTNISKNKDILSKQGLKDELITRFTIALESIANDKQLQYQIGSNRKSIVQDNLALLNGLYQQLVEILVVGKILYKATNPAKLQEYTFEELKKRVRKTIKSPDESALGTSKTENAPAI